MAFAITRPAVDTTSGGVLIAQNTTSSGEADFGTKRALIKNLTGTASVFLGPQGVTTANGFQWDVADGPLEVELEPGEAIYGIVAATPQTLHVLAQGR